MTLPIHIVADANIVAAEEAFGRYGEVRLMPGSEISAPTVRLADALFVRSVTHTNATLLDGSSVRFVGTATAGVDHLDLDFLKRADIDWASAPGSNADSVADYVIASIIALAAKRGEAVEGRVLGVVGVGNVGGRVARRAQALGMTTLLCDPPLERERSESFVDMDEVLEASDIVTLHTPLTEPCDSPHPTRRLLDASALRRMKHNAWLVNSSRGGVTDGDALLEAIQSGKLGGCILDVWPDEPIPSVQLIAHVDFATPHIAGYSIDAKVAGTVAIERALRSWLVAQGATLPPAWDPAPLLLESAPPHVNAPQIPDVRSPVQRTTWLDAVARQARDVRSDDALFRSAMASAIDSHERAAAFAAMRRTYPRRAELSRHALVGCVPKRLDEALRVGLGMRVAL